MYRDSFVIKTGYYCQQISNNEPKEIFYKLFNADGIFSHNR